MKAGKQFTQEQKLTILQSAKEVGVKEAAELAGVHYTTVYDWRKKLEALGKENFLANVTKSRGRGQRRSARSRKKQYWTRGNCTQGLVLARSVTSFAARE